MKFLSGIAPYLGLASPIVAFLFIITAILTHPWFSFWQNALSDLGNPKENWNWIFNCGLIIAGVLGLLFAADLFGRVNGAERVAAAVFAVATLLLAMIGLFPEGSALHFPSAVLFYLLSAVAITICGVAWILTAERRMYGILSLVMVAAGIAVAVLPDWDGIAIPETAGAIIVFAWVYMMVWQTYFSTGV